MINHFASKKAIQAFRVIILTNHSCGKFFFSSRPIISTNHSCGRIFSASTWKINHFSKNVFSTNETSTAVFFGAQFYCTGLVFPNPVHRKCLFSSHVFVCTHQSAARLRLSVENSWPERAVCREARSNLKAGGLPLFPWCSNGLLGAGGGGISVEPPLVGEASMPTRIPKHGSAFFSGYSPEQR